MKNLILICLVFVATGLSAQVYIPGPNEKPGQAAEIKFDKDEHDYGTIKQGANGTYEFKFKNTGKEPLIISNAQGSCGCTVPEWPKAPIRPGEAATIKVTYDTNRLGPIDKSVKISSNAKNDPEKILKIKGAVEAAN
jgi:hypothetical protein